MQEGKKNAVEATLERFAEAMISRMEEMKSSNWQKGWLRSSFLGLPKNLSGRPYAGANAFMLLLLSEAMGYKSSVFLTFKQAIDLRVSIAKGEKAYPVTYWDLDVKDKEGKRISVIDYRNMSDEDKSQCVCRPFMKIYYVFNLDQTNFAKIYPEKYEELATKMKKSYRSEDGMYKNDAVDRMIERQEWICPIEVRESNNAYYSTKSDIIILPLKQQFNLGGEAADVIVHGMEYYSTAFHEMAHSTGSPERLNRFGCGIVDHAQRAKEELVAELTSALVGQSLGFDSRIANNNACYVNSWIDEIKEKPRFIVSVMADVNKASEMLINAIDKQKIALGEEPLNPNNIKSKEDSLIKNPSISCYTYMSCHISMKPKVSATVSGSHESKALSAPQAALYNKLDKSEKQAYADSLARKHFTAQTLEKNSISRSHSYRL